MAVENALLQTCPACGTSIDTTDAEPLAKVACPKCGEKVRVERSFNNFVLLETLGVGGMGTVYKARDTLLDRDVALKLLRKDLGGGLDQTKLLQQEARVAASVNHPNVIQVFSSGIDHGQFYLVMELVDRGSLDDFIEERKQLSEEHVLEAGIQVAKGLRAAYAKGLIHRDVKPANILFADEHTAKIGDFGLAGVAAETAGNEIWGTPYYVAPERLKNEPEDFRSDIYSLGGTLFHALAGTAPIEGDTNSAVALLQLKQHPVDLRKVVPGVSLGTVRTFERMLASDPAERFASYDELVSALEEAHGVVTGSEQFVGKKRRRRLLIGVAVLLVALIGVGAWALISGKQAAQTVDAVKAQAEKLIALAPLEGRLSDARHQLLQIPPHYNVAGSAFAQIATDAKNRQPIYDWAKLQQGLSAYIGREPSQALSAFQEVEKAGTSGFAPEDADLGKFFVSAAKILSASGSVSKDALTTTSGAAAIAPLLYGLKDVVLIDVADAVPLLEQFVNAKPDGKFAWIADYKPLAQRYLDDCRSYATWKNESGPTVDRLAKLRAIRLKQKSALSDQLSEEDRRLTNELNDQTAAQEAAKKKQLELVAQKRPEWLASWKNKLIQDINQRTYSGGITDVAGVPYSGIKAATADKLTVSIAYGNIPIDWAKLSPKTLLAISRSFIQPNAADAADRQWLCAVYANETGQTDEAKQLAEAAGKSKPEYRDLTPALVK
jgi:predicted RNA-binding Zn-ribbon protein involved in translation (DUF1610 family)